MSVLTSVVCSLMCLQNMMIKKHALELTTSFIIPLVCMHVYDLCACVIYACD